MSETIREKAVSKLLGGRQLTSGEAAELDTFAVVLQLNDNDPFWLQLVWMWATTPKKEWLDLHHRALAAEIRQDFKELLASAPAVAAMPSADFDYTKLDEIKKAIHNLNKVKSATPGTQPATNQDAAWMKLAILQATKDARVVSVDEFVHQIKEMISWFNAGLAAVILGLCLFVGFEFGGYMQAQEDNSKIFKLEKQVTDLTAALPKK